MMAKWLKVTCIQRVHLPDRSNLLSKEEVDRTSLLRSFCNQALGNVKQVKVLAAKCEKD